MRSPAHAEDLLRTVPVAPTQESDDAPAEPDQEALAPPKLKGAPIDLHPAPARPPNLVNVPLPPSKPADLLAQQTAPSSEAEAEAGDVEPVQAPAQALPVLAAKPQAPPAVAGAQPQLASLPEDRQASSLPLPPSMKDGQPPDAESDGEEEGSSAGNFEKQIETVDVACVKPAVLEIVKRAGQFFRAVPIVTSGFRARGRRGSLHRRCMAIDFVVPGVSTQTLANYLKSQPDAGGVGTYCNTKSVHIDIGEKRNWGYCGFHRTYFSMR